MKEAFSGEMIGEQLQDETTHASVVGLRGLPERFLYLHRDSHDENLIPFHTNCIYKIHTQINSAWNARAARSRPGESSRARSF